MKYIKILFVLFFLLILGVEIMPFDYVDASSGENKIYCYATLEDEFANDTILVVLNEDASNSDKIYTLGDFELYGCINITDLTSEATSIIQNKDC